MMTIRGPTAPKIYTIGYEGLGLEDFVGRLRRAGVRIVIDVRELPLSRKRGFSKGALAEALATARIRYSHMRSLGCPKPIRDRHRANKDWTEYTAAFMKHLGTQRAAVDELAQVCAERPAALLCYEADAGRCHRTYVARGIAAVSGGEVFHINATGILGDEA